MMDRNRSKAYFSYQIFNKKKIPFLPIEKAESPFGSREHP